MRKLYLASAIEGISLKTLQAHYLEVANLLESQGFEMINRHIQNNYISESDASATGVRQVIEDDLKTLRQADLLLVDYTIPNRNYVGATCEIVYAHLWGKPIIVYVEQSDNGQRYWLRYHATYICETLSQALTYICKNYT